MLRGSDDGILSKTRGKESQQTHALKAELQKLLSQPLVSRGVMKKYITSGTQDVVSDLLADEDGKWDPAYLLHELIVSLRSRWIIRIQKR